jgi:uncharacterized protein (TIGR02145 family)
MHQNNMNRVKMLVVGLFAALQPLLIYGQIAVGGDNPDQSAVLDLQSNSKGFLISRMTTAERNSIASPAVGLMIYNTGTYCLEINVGTTSAPEWSAISCRTGAISGIDCAGATVTGSLVSGVSATGVSVSVPYTGGNSGAYVGQTVSSTGVTGLTATLSAGSFAGGSGSVSYDITGTPSGVGTASFALNIGGQSCTLDVTASYSCKAKIDATTFKNFLCYNLGAANTSANPFTPSWEIVGGHWQWGRLAQAAPGPTGPGAGDANDGAISGWNNTDAPDGSWSDASKTINDPCPAGYRVPTMAEWDGVRLNNTLTNVGTWTNSGSTNYSSGKNFGTGLFLPAAGLRSNTSNGALFNRGYFGYYWSSSEDSPYSLYLGFREDAAYQSDQDRVAGYSVRCIAESD